MALRHERIAAGLCADCGSPRGSRGSKWYCRQHARKRATREMLRQRKIIAVWRERGLCIRCGDSRDGTAKTCWACRYKDSQSKKRTSIRRLAAPEPAE